MSFSICVRPLTHEENDYFRKSSLGRETTSLGPLSIMGPADHRYIKYLNIETVTYRVDLGEGQYIHDGAQVPLATGGKVLPIAWSHGFDYLLVEAKKLNISVVYNRTSPPYRDPLYFESKYAESFLECVSYADRALVEWRKNLSFLDRMFGAIYPEQSVSTSIREGIRRILIKTK